MALSQNKVEVPSFSLAEVPGPPTKEALRRIESYLDARIQKYEKVDLLSRRGVVPSDILVRVNGNLCRVSLNYTQRSPIHGYFIVWVNEDLTPRATLAETMMDDDADGLIDQGAKWDNSEECRPRQDKGSEFCPAYQNHYNLAMAGASLYVGLQKR